MLATAATAKFSGRVLVTGEQRRHEGRQPSRQRLCLNDVVDDHLDRHGWRRSATGFAGHGGEPAAQRFPVRAKNVADPQLRFKECIR